MGAVQSSASPSHDTAAETAALGPSLLKHHSQIHPHAHSNTVDGYTQASGFTLTAADQAAYNTWLADTAHSLGLAVGLKNDLDQLATLQPKFDFFVK